MNSEAISLIDKFRSLNLSSIIDFDKFSSYAITHHSTTIEGSTLTEVETRLLLDEGITPAGKPLLHSLMVQDHYNALLFVIEKALKKNNCNAAFYSGNKCCCAETNWEHLSNCFWRIRWCQRRF